MVTISNPSIAISFISSAILSSLKYPNHNPEPKLFKAHT